MWPADWHLCDGRDAAAATATATAGAAIYGATGASPPAAPSHVSFILGAFNHPR